MSHTIEEWEQKLVGKVFVGPGEEAPKDKKPDQVRIYKKIKLIEYLVVYFIIEDI